MEDIIKSENKYYGSYKCWGLSDNKTYVIPASINTNDNAKRWKIFKVILDVEGISQDPPSTTGNGPA